MRSPLTPANARPLADVPRPAWLALAVALAAQLCWQAGRPPPAPPALDLPAPPPLAVLQLASLGEPLALSRATMLYVQDVDEQAGRSVAWRSLDYGKIAGWLALALQLDPRSQYPLLVASEVYGAIGAPAQQRVMLDFVYARFGDDPNRRWPWLAQAAIVAKHRLHDLPLALRYARAIRLQATGPGVPAWARELEVFVLEDMREIDSARILVGGLLHSGQITDPRELQFLARRLDALTAEAAAAAAGKKIPGD